MSEKFHVTEENGKIRIKRQNPASGYFFDVLSKAEAHELFEKLCGVLIKGDHVE